MNVYFYIQFEKHFYTSQINITFKIKIWRKKKRNVVKLFVVFPAFQAIKYSTENIKTVFFLSFSHIHTHTHTLLPITLLRPLSCKMASILTHTIFIMGYKLDNENSPPHLDYL